MRHALRERARRLQFTPEGRALAKTMLPARRLGTMRRAASRAAADTRFAIPLT